MKFLYIEIFLLFNLIYFINCNNLTRRKAFEIENTDPAHSNLLLTGNTFADKITSAALQVAKDITRRVNNDIPENNLNNFRESQELCPFKNVGSCNPDDIFRSFDGSCNNLMNPWWGKAETPYKRYVKPAYDDGVDAARARAKSGNPLPNPRALSTLNFDNSESESISTHIVAIFGQFLTFDLTSAKISADYNGAKIDCPCGVKNPSCLSVEIPPGDRVLTMACMKFTRSSAAFSKFDCQLDQREQLNTLSAFLDGSNIYGSSESKTKFLRSMFGGQLRSTPTASGRPYLLQGEDPKCRDTGKNIRCFTAGENRTNENLGLVSIYTLFMRHHNNIAQQLEILQPKWNDEQLYQQARRIVLATLQHIVYNEFLPTVIGFNAANLFDIIPLKNGQYFGGYDQTVNPSIANDFSTAGFRYGHTSIRNKFSRANINNQITGSVDLANIVFRPVEAYNDAQGGIDSILFGLFNDPAAKYDTSFADTLQNHLFESTSSDGKKIAVDLIATNINRGRDHGLPSYNSYREFCGFPRAKHFDDLSDTIQSDKLKLLSQVYEDVDDIDLYLGGLSETPLTGAIVGPIFACIIGNQFSDLKRGDRFFYENGPSNTAFSLDQLEELRKVSLSSIICDNTDLLEIQPRVFLQPLHNLRNQRVPCNSITPLNLRPWAVMK